MILLSALLASLSGLVAGERSPERAPAQVHASAFVAAAKAENAAAVSQVRALSVPPASAAAEPRQAHVRLAVQPPARTRLALKQSWLE